MKVRWLAYPAVLLAGLLAAGCGESDPDPAAAPPAADPAPPADQATEDDGDGAAEPAVPDEQQLCGAVDEAPIAQVLTDEITVRAFHPPSGSGVNISCTWETVTRSFTVKFYFQPSFRTLVDDDILAEYGEGEFDGLGVEAHRAVWPNGLIIAGPGGTAIELNSAGGVNASDEDLVAIGQAALSAAQGTYG